MITLGYTETRTTSQFFKELFKGKLMAECNFSSRCFRKINNACKQPIPKFGSWEGAKNVGYTTCFDSARKGRASHGVTMNPNDPEAFLSLRVDMEKRKNAQSGKPPRHVNSKPSAEVLKAIARNTHARTNVKSQSPQSFSSEDGSEKSLITGSKINRKDPTLQIANSITQENHHVVATVPKFGSWDETDPRSGDGFSIIFNKVKEQKHITPTSLRPPRQEQHRSYSNGQCRHRNSLFSKICCCRS